MKGYTDRQKQYFAKLKDPRWQKKRLEIFQRDGFTCRVCGGAENTLNVHHFYYRSGCEPWDYPDDALITLCEPCHEEETEIRPREEKLLVQVLREQCFFGSQVDDIALAFHEPHWHGASDPLVDALTWAMRDKDIMEELIRRYCEHMHKKHEKWQKQDDELSPA